MTVASSVTSPGAAMASPPFRSIRAMQASIDSLDTSLHATLAPYLASASATPLPMLGPTPVTSATLPSRDTSTVACSLPYGPADYVATRPARQSSGGTEDAGRTLGYPPNHGPGSRSQRFLSATPS